MGIIPSQSLPWGDEEWHGLLRCAVRDARELAAALELEASDLGVDLTPDFPVRVPAPFLSRMRRGDANDPLLRQVLPLDAENDPVPGYNADPLEEAGAVVAPGLLQKYPGRALLVTTQACAVHCRYCFRRHFPYSDHRPANHDPAIDYLHAHPEVEELILSGGDPLSLPDKPLQTLLARLGELDYLRVRIHTRLPVVLPQRVTRDLLESLEGTPRRPVIIVHINHAAEIDSDVTAALTALRNTGALLLNQTVMLRGVNDTAEAQIELAGALVDSGVTPYYLHLPDQIAGTAHFAVDVKSARRLRNTLRDTLPGYMVPTLVQELPGYASKTRL